MKLHHIGINVSSLERSKQFYQTHFGFKEEFTAVIGSEEIVLLKRDEERLELIQDGDSALSQSMVHFAWETADLEAEIERLSRLGLEPVEGPVQLDNGWRAVFYKGPDGELIELINAGSS
ncbi:VOC family protein [Rossellomorea oryzaecorticis]|uniref:VOC family protein n=1 Tax=Rossellomorea oryzaecorticis TaxID=1396505 RepID=A0ABW8VPU6_9BACI